MTQYKLDDLGWLSFERLSQALLKAQFGWALESWGGSKDLGRDAYSEIDLTDKYNQSISGPSVFQCKFVSNSQIDKVGSAKNLINAVDIECELIRQRIKVGKWRLPKSYILLTNCHLSVATRAKIIARLNNCIQDCTVMLQGYSDICALLDNNPAIRISYPELMGICEALRSIDTNITRDIAERTETALCQAQDVRKVFVATQAYYEALDKLNQYNFVVLTGAPEMGKTTIGRILGLAKYENKWDFLDCRNSNDYFRVRDDTRSQLFFADDAFGSNSFDPNSTLEWSRDIAKIIHRLDAKHWFIWTSRSVPLNEALIQLKLDESFRNFPEPAKIIVNASNLTIGEKAQIFYRHAKAAGLSQGEKDLIKKHAIFIVKHPDFTPLRIRRFVSEHIRTIFTQLSSADSLHGSTKMIMHLINIAIRQYTEYMHNSFCALSNGEKAFLYSLLDTDKTDLSLDSVLRIFMRMTELGVEEFNSIAARLDNHFVRYQHN
jgi:hypothetical protein